MEGLAGYYPNDVFSFFEKISSIPHESGKEERMADYIESVARSADLWCYRDELHNVLVKKPASAGFEDFPSVLLQGHMDMVCEKIPSSEHDFDTEPLSLFVRDGFLCAQGTTLGADDGIAVAMMLAILTDNALQHGPIECLFTVDEERGMTGAEFFDYTKITSRRVINLDTETEGECIVSCAGGADIHLQFDNEFVKNVHPSAQITITGLAGGHSGADIHLGRANANQIMARFLSEEYAKKPFHLISFNGGSKHNVIPGACSAMISCDDLDCLRSSAKAFERLLRQEVTEADSRVCVRISKKGVREQALSFRQTYRILTAIMLAPAGVLNTSADGVVEASSNLGVVKTDAGETALEYLFRFNKESRYQEYLAKYRAAADLLGARMLTAGYYSCWEKKEASAFEGIYRETYRKLYHGKEARVTGIHAGVECGFISKGLGKDAEIISIGPDIYDIHTPRERMDILSVGRTYGLLLKLICAK